MLRSILFGLSACLLVSCSSAAEEPQSPPHLELTGRVVDAAELLEPEFEAELTQTLVRLETDTQVTLVVATTPDLKGLPIDQYSLELANAWGIGDAERNDGLVMLFAPNERKVRIEVGLGLEEVVTNEEASLIIEEGMLPELQNGNFEEGIRQGVFGLVREVRLVHLKEAA